MQLSALNAHIVPVSYCVTMVAHMHDAFSAIEERLVRSFQIRPRRKSQPTDYQNDWIIRYVTAKVNWAVSSQGQS